MRLDKRAEIGSPTPSSLWHVDGGCALFAGPLQHNALHRHSVPVYLAGLYGDFRLRIDGANWRSCRTAVLPAGVGYEFDMAGEPLAVLYPEPNVAGADALVPLVGNACEVGGAVVGSAGEIALLRDIYERRAGHEELASALKSLTDHACKRTSRHIDRRIAHAVAIMQSYADMPNPADEIAAAVGLSPSHFQHLFTDHVGVPFRRYRAWHRLRAAIREVTHGANYTQAAQAAGFFDQSHFARHFRRTFGAPASRGLRQVP
jgi:AraC-like DNA-binding protein